jgi:hypothetical protein
MTDQLLTVLKFALLALIYVFFGRVLWAVWSQVRTPRPAVGIAPTAAQPKTNRRAGRAERKMAKMVVLEPKERRGERFFIAAELVVGRGPECALSFPEDSFLSTVNTRLYPSGDSIWVEDLNSTNGTFVNGQRVNGARELRRGDRVQAGHTVVELQ